MKQLVRTTLFAGMVLLVAALTACNAPTPEVTDEGESGEEATVESYDALLDALKAEGLAAESSDEEVEQPFFSVKARVIAVGDEQVQVLEYPDEATAQTEADAISPDGSSIGTSMVTWIGTPHFYRSGKLLVLYVGDNADLLAALEAILGAQIAGG